MVEFHEISVDQAKNCIEVGDFAREITMSNLNVAIILTQSWCPEWAGMKRYLADFEDPDLDVWLFLYDLSLIYEEFLRFKEDIWGNASIPYIRYYKNADLITSTNAVSKDRFVQIFESGLNGG